MPVVAEQNSRSARLPLLSAVMILALTARDSVGADGLVTLESGDSFAGTLSASSQADCLGWQTNFAASEFVFPLDKIRSARFIPSAASPERLTSLFCFELRDGQSIYGTPISSTNDSIVVRTSLLGDLTLNISSLSRFYRTDSARMALSDGLQGLNGWKVDGAPTDWIEEAGSLVAEVRGASIVQEISLPARFSVDVDAEWTPDFGFTFEFGNFFRIEGTGSKVTAVWEQANSGDALPLAHLSNQPCRLALRAFVDQQAGRVQIVDFNGKQLGTLSVKRLAENAAPDGSLSVRLTSYCSRLQIKRLVISDWEGAAPSSLRASGVAVRMTSGALHRGDAFVVDAASATLQLSAAGNKLALDLGQVQSVRLSERTYASRAPFWICLVDGSFFDFHLQRQGAGALTLKTSLTDRELTVPAGAVRSISNMAADRFSREATPRGRRGRAVVVDGNLLVGGDDANDETGGASAEPPPRTRLDAEGVVSYGELLPHSEMNGAYGLAWRPADSLVAAPIRTDAQVRIRLRYADQQPKRDDESALYRALGYLPAIAPADVPEQNMGPAPALDSDDSYLVLANGDRIQAHVASFDDVRVRVESKLFSSREIPASEVRVWESSAHSAIDRMDSERRRRLLTLPRKQRNAPPTHLLESTNGDFMRTRLSGADEGHVFANRQLNQLPIPRSSLQRVAWLLTPNMATERSTPPSAPSKDLAVLEGEMRVTLRATTIAEGNLVGHSDSLGELRLALSSIKELRLGATASLPDDAPLARETWRLHDAIDPIYMQDGELEENQRMTGGLTSPLVGKRAPVFALTSTSGETVRLNEMRGKVVVIDFWACWCGPCLQAMPQIVSVVNSFKSDDVKFVSVNAGDSPERIAETLLRLELDPLVLRDPEGRAATDYMVKSLPYTVVVDRHGKVARVFVGVRESFEKQLRFAIEELLSSRTAGEHQERRSSEKQSVRIVINVDRAGPAINPSFYGLMMEEINHSFDGGLYGEVIRNRTFREEPSVEEAAPPAHWRVVAGTQGGLASRTTASIDYNNPVNNRALARSLRVDIPQLAAGARVGVANDGFWGIPAGPHLDYHVSFYARCSSDQERTLTVAIEDVVSGSAWATARIDGVTKRWQRFDVKLHTGDVPESKTNCFTISTRDSGTLWLSLVSMFPPTYANRSNGARKDLVELLSAMQPQFLRFPGGNDVEGRSLTDRFNWKDSIGPLEERRGHTSVWGYHASDGMGLLEMLTLCEDMGIEPVVAVFAGFALNGEQISAGPKLEPYVQDALDEIEYIVGDASTIWGARRAQDGHPEPFKLRFIEIGNQDGGRSYEDRFAQFYDAIKAAYPHIQVIATSHVKSRRPDMVDEHYFQSPDVMMALASHFDHYPRDSPKIFVGEWASKQGDPTPTHYAALADAAWLTGLERNADVVMMSCYAPLLVNVNPGARQYRTNLVCYDALRCYGSPSYYVQKMFAANRGDRVVPIDVEGLPTVTAHVALSASQQTTMPIQMPTLFAVASEQWQSGDVIVKLVNAIGDIQPVEVELHGVTGVRRPIRVIELTGQPNDVNSLENPKNVFPRERTIEAAGSSITTSIEPFTVAVMVIDAERSVSPTNSNNQ